MLDIERIIQTGIPDIAPVYGGVRGRTMSSRHQAYAWPAIKEAGVNTIIDLREMDKSDKLPYLCQYHGLEYFHYPLDNHARTIAQMVVLFPKFCEQIDKGDFYIACAMGLHRTDIALCTYWVFYAADKGIAPPPIRGYRQELGRQTLLIWKMGAGNSAKRFNGENPIPEKTKIATKDSWNIEPMPDKHSTIPMNVSIPSEALRIVKYGHIPDAMEDHWFMYCDEKAIRYYRSWTGFCIYVAKYEDDGETCRITELTVNREPEQYTCTDDKHDIALFMALLTEEYGGDASEYWKKAFRKK